MSSRDDTHELSWFGERCLRIEFAGDASSALARVHAAFAALKQAALPGLLDLAPAYRTLLLTFDPLRLDGAEAKREVGRVLDSLVGATDGLPPPRIITIPACYDPALAPDLESLARLHGLSADDVARLHAAPEYTVAFLGFSPGFPYLTGLPLELHTPRHARPRTRVAAGSIGIAGDQAGIYPHATPGGWQIIGRTPLRLFDIRRDTPALLAPGDRVRFVPISVERFRELAAPEGGT